jgi:hypothetical protein
VTDLENGLPVADGNPAADRQATGMVAAPTTAQGTADLAAQTLPPDEREALAATVVKSLDSPEQQQAAAEGVVGALPDEAKQNLAATVVKSLDSPEQQRAAAESALSALAPRQQAQVVESVLGSPDTKTRQRLWYIVVGTMAAAVFFFGSMAFVLIYQRKAAEGPLALATTALGALVGLVATSPGSRRGD